jgi:hypothetical protein
MSLLDMLFAVIAVDPAIVPQNPIVFSLSVSLTGFTRLQLTFTTLILLTLFIFLAGHVSGTTRRYALLYRSCIVPTFVPLVPYASQWDARTTLVFTVSFVILVWIDK